MCAGLRCLSTPRNINPIWIVPMRMVKTGKLLGRIDYLNIFLFIDTGFLFECDVSCAVQCDIVTCKQFHRSAGYPGHEAAGANNANLHMDV